jgi:23S rRNA pseudouridine1911/1915/1917 synthase
MGEKQVFHVATEQANRTLAAALRAWLPGSSWAHVRKLIHGRRVMVSGNICTEESRRLKPKDVVKILDQAAQKPPQETDVEVVHLDEHVCVVVKPAGINTTRHEDERHQRRPQFQSSLAELLPRVLRKMIVGEMRHQSTFARVFPVHRLDRETGGLVVFARSRRAEKHLAEQFRDHSVHRIYQAIVPGRVTAQTISTHLVRDRGDGLRGSAADGQGGRKAVTHIRPLEELPGFTLIECRLETGRTHQIRIHLSELGHPLCGEKVYTRRLHGKSFRDTSGAPRLALHAAELGFVHPVGGRALRFTCPWPRDLAQFLARLRQSGTTPAEERSS